MLYDECHVFPFYCLGVKISNLDASENRVLSKEACETAAQWWANQIGKNNQESLDSLVSVFLEAVSSEETTVTDDQRKKFSETLAKSLEQMDIAGIPFGTDYDAHPVIEDALKAAKLPSGLECLPAKTKMTISLDGKIEIGAYKKDPEVIFYKTTQSNKKSGLRSEF